MVLKDFLIFIFSSVLSVIKLCPLNNLQIYSFLWIFRLEYENSGKFNEKYIS